MDFDEIFIPQKVEDDNQEPQDKDKTKKEKRDDLYDNIYGDVCDYDLGYIIDHEKEKNKILEQENQELKDGIMKLQDELLTLKENENNLSSNISSLFLTAKAEIDRKNRQITELSGKLDDMHFRRNNRWTFKPNFKHKDYTHNENNIENVEIEKCPTITNTDEQYKEPPIVEPLHDTEPCQEGNFIDELELKRLQLVKKISEVDSGLEKSRSRSTSFERHGERDNSKDRYLNNRRRDDWDRTEYSRRNGGYYEDDRRNFRVSNRGWFRYSYRGKYRNDFRNRYRDEDDYERYPRNRNRFDYNEERDREFSGSRSCVDYNEKREREFSGGRSRLDYKERRDSEFSGRHDRFDNEEPERPEQSHKNWMEDLRGYKNDEFDSFDSRNPRFLDRDKSINNTRGRSRERRAETTENGKRRTLSLGPPRKHKEENDREERSKAVERGKDRKNVQRDNNERNDGKREKSLGRELERPIKSEEGDRGRRRTLSVGPNRRVGEIHLERDRKNEANERKREKTVSERGNDRSRRELYDNRQCEREERNNEIERERAKKSTHSDSSERNASKHEKNSGRELERSKKDEGDERSKRRALSVGPNRRENEIHLEKENRSAGYHKNEANERKREKTLSERGNDRSRRELCNNGYNEREERNNEIERERDKKSTHSDSSERNASKEEKRGRELERSKKDERDERSKRRALSVGPNRREEDEIHLEREKRSAENHKHEANESGRQEKSLGRELERSRKIEEDDTDKKRVVGPNNREEGEICSDEEENAGGHKNETNVRRRERTISERWNESSIQKSCDRQDERKEDKDSKSQRISIRRKTVGDFGYFDYEICKKKDDTFERNENCVKEQADDVASQTINCNLKENAAKLAVPQEQNKNSEKSIEIEKLNQNENYAKKETTAGVSSQRKNNNLKEDFAKVTNPKEQKKYLEKMVEMENQNKMFQKKPTIDFESKKSERAKKPMLKVVQKLEKEFRKNLDVPVEKTVNDALFDNWDKASIDSWTEVTCRNAKKSLPENKTNDAKKRKDEEREKSNQKLLELFGEITLDGMEESKECLERKEKLKKEEQKSENDGADGDKRKKSKRSKTKNSHNDTVVDADLDEYLEKALGKPGKLKAQKEKKLSKENPQDVKFHKDEIKTSKEQLQQEDNKIRNPEARREDNKLSKENEKVITDDGKNMEKQEEKLSVENSDTTKIVGCFRRGRRRIVRLEVANEKTEENLTKEREIVQGIQINGILDDLKKDVKAKLEGLKENEINGNQDEDVASERPNPSKVILISDVRITKDTTEIIHVHTKCSSDTDEQCKVVGKSKTDSVFHRNIEENMERIMEGHKVFEDSGDNLKIPKNGEIEDCGKKEASRKKEKIKDKSKETKLNKRNLNEDEKIVTTEENIENQQPDPRKEVLAPVNQDKEPKEPVREHMRNFNKTEVENNENITPTEKHPKKKPVKRRLTEDPDPQETKRKKIVDQPEPYKTPDHPVSQPVTKRRITPIPVKDGPICTFENILSKSQSPSFNQEVNSQAGFQLTHEGDIPLLHIEEPIFSYTSDDFAKNPELFKLIEGINLSTFTCDTLKFKIGSDDSKASIGSLKELTFENFMEKAQSTPLVPVNLPSNNLNNLTEVTSNPVIDTVNLQSEKLSSNVVNVSNGVCSELDTSTDDLKKSTAVSESDNSNNKNSLVNTATCSNNVCTKSDMSMVTSVINPINSSVNNRTSRRVGSIRRCRIVISID